MGNNNYSFVVFEKVYEIPKGLSVNETDDKFRRIAGENFHYADYRKVTDFIGSCLYGNKSRDEVLEKFFGEEWTGDRTLMSPLTIFCADISWYAERYMGTAIVDPIAEDIVAPGCFAPEAYCEDDGWQQYLRSIKEENDKHPREAYWEDDEGLRHYLDENQEQLPDVHPVDPIYAEMFLKQKGLYEEYRKFEQFQKFQSLWHYDEDTREDCFEGNDICAFWSICPHDENGRCSLVMSFGDWYTDDIFCPDFDVAKNLVYEIWENPSDYIILGQRAEGGLLFKLSTAEVWETDRWQHDDGLAALIKRLKG